MFAGHRMDVLATYVGEGNKIMANAGSMNSIDYDQHEALGKANLRIQRLP